VTGGWLDGKVALISGGARGQEAARGALFAYEGAAVLLGDILNDTGEERAAALRAEGLDVRCVHLDVTCWPDWAGARRDSPATGRAVEEVSAAALYLASDESSTILEKEADAYLGVIRHFVDRKGQGRR
jgi:hypothetical protein